MSDKIQDYTPADIHRFTDSDGIERVHIPWGMITGEIPDGVVYPTSTRSENFDCWAGSSFYEDHGKTYPKKDAMPFAFIPADRIEVVTEHVEATVMDALQALVESGGEPVKGWRFYDECRAASVDLDLHGAAFEVSYPFRSSGCGWVFALRPVTRVRIKPEAKPEPGYGYTLDGNPVPPPPEGWEIVPEGDGIGVSCIYYAPDTQEWEEGGVNGSHAFVAYRARAYARRVVKESLTAEAAATADACHPVNLKSLFDVVDAILSIESDANQVPNFLWTKIEAFKKEVRGE